MTLIARSNRGEQHSPRGLHLANRSVWSGSFASRTLIAASYPIGLGLVYFGDTLSREGSSYGNAASPFWIGLLLLYVPTAGFVLSRREREQGQLPWLIVLSLGLYLVKVIGSPHGFTFVDEYVHYRNTQNLISSHHLFGFNPLLPTAAYYPGLASATASLMDVAHIGMFPAGLIVIGAARIVLVGFTYLIVSSICKSKTAGAFAALLYIANPMYVFWSSNFTYEDLALPLAVFAVWWLGTLLERGFRVRQLLLALPVLLAVVITHHVAALALSVLLVVWWAVSAVVGLDRDRIRFLGSVALITSTATIAWLVLVAKPALRYLFTNNLEVAIQNTRRVLSGKVAVRHLFVSGSSGSARTGQLTAGIALQAPAWERFAGYASVGCLLLALPAALLVAYRHRSSVGIVVAALIAAVYPASLLPRLAPLGVNISGRSSEYLYFGLGCSIALVLTRWPTGRSEREKHQFRVRSPLVVTPFLCIVFVGSVTIGTAYFQQLPESAHPKGYPLDAQPQALAIAAWAKEHLGPNQIFASPQLDTGPLAAEGDENPVSGVNLWPLYFDTNLNSAVLSIIQNDHIAYLLVDWQMTRDPPVSPGYFVSPYEPDYLLPGGVLPAVALDKFANARCVTEVKRIGTLEIFDTRALRVGC